VSGTVRVKCEKLSSRVKRGSECHSKDIGSDCLEQPGRLGVATHTPMNRENIIQSICFAGLLAMFCVLSIHVVCSLVKPYLSKRIVPSLTFPKFTPGGKTCQNFRQHSNRTLRTIFHLDWLSFVQETWLPLKFSTRLATLWWLLENKTGYSINPMCHSRTTKSRTIYGRRAAYWHKTSSSEIHF